jgi:hypothetical protein
VNTNNGGFRKSIALKVNSNGYANFAAPINLIVTVCGSETYTYNNVTSYTAVLEEDTHLIGPNHGADAFVFTFPSSSDSKCKDYPGTDQRYSLWSDAAGTVPYAGGLVQYKGTFAKRNS